MKKMEEKQVSERLYFKRNNEELQIEITQQIPRIKETLLITWLVAWLVCGLVFIGSWLESTGDQSMFLGISVAFWAFFMFRIGKVYFWRKKGKEIIRFKEGLLTIQNAIGSKGKVSSFRIQNINSFGQIAMNQGNFLQSLDFSFWVIGGDRLGFNYESQKIRFGKQLNDKEITVLARIFEKAIKSFK